jgi:hypothetical protein
MTITHMAHHPGSGPSGDAQPARRRQSFGQVAEHDPHQQGDADTSLQHGEAEHEGLGASVDADAPSAADATLASSTLVSSKAAMMPAAFACTSVSLPA